MIDPKPEDINRGVVYKPNYPGSNAEDGVLVRYTDDLVFVKYKSQHPSARPIATRKEDLTWLTK